MATTIPGDYDSLRTDLAAARAEIDRLRQAHDDLRADAYALVWFIPGTVNMDLVKRKKREMYDLVKLAHRVIDLAPHLAEELEKVGASR
jgi:hypothetical protein